MSPLWVLNFILFIISVNNVPFSVLQVGHSLGGALSELDSLFLTLNLPSSASIKAITYGTPRVGNLAFAQLIDSKVCLILCCLLKWALKIFAGPKL